MTLTRRLYLVALAVGLSISTPAQKATDVLLTVGGEITHPQSLTRADLEKFARQTVKAKTRDGKEHTYEGVAVGDLLQKAGVQFGEAIHQEVAASYLLAEASDGYRVVFALPEFDSPSMDRLIVIADRVDGNPLPAGTGPLQLIAPGDHGHGRWVRQVRSLMLKRAPKSQP